MITELTRQQYSFIGAEVTRLLSLTPDLQGRYLTKWGRCTSIEIAETIKELFEEAAEHVE